MWQSSFSSFVDVILWDAVSGWWQCAQWQWWRHPRPLRFTNTAASYPDPTPHTLAQLEVIYESDWEENETQLLSPPGNFPAEVKIRSCHFIPKEDSCVKTPVGYFKQQVNLRRTPSQKQRWQDRKWDFSLSSFSSMSISSDHFYRCQPARGKQISIVMLLHKMTYERLGPEIWTIFRVKNQTRTKLCSVNFGLHYEQVAIMLIRWFGRWGPMDSFLVKGIEGGQVAIFSCCNLSTKWTHMDKYGHRCRQGDWKGDNRTQRKWNGHK